jgi:hypothetical protein
MFVSVGTSITQVNDNLVKMDIAELAHRIKNPKEQFKNRIDQLRIAKAISEQRYKELKKSLPYFTCANLHPLIRRKEYFTGIFCFVVDIDHVSRTETTLDQITEKLKNDPRVLLQFVSPGNDGVKLLFRLKEMCKDAVQFSAFYKIFVKRFAVENQLETCVDFKTSDVTRACFISYDEDAFFNPECEAIDMNTVLPEYNFDAALLELKEAEKFLKSLPKADNPQQKLEEDVFNKIKQKLNPKARIVKEKNHYQPEELDDFVKKIGAKSVELGLELKLNEPIHYGRKLQFKTDIHWCEINVFHGKRGYSVVKSPKTGSNLQLADLMCQAILELLDYEHEPPKK